MIILTAFPFLSPIWSALKSTKKKKKEKNKKYYLIIDYHNLDTVGPLSSFTNVFEI